MNKKLILGISALVVVSLAAGGYLWWAKSHQTQAPTAADQAVTGIQDTVGSINRRVIQDMPPATGSATAGSTTDITNVNPYRNTNPFSDLKTNPFE